MNQIREIPPLVRRGSPRREPARATRRPRGTRDAARSDDQAPRLSELWSELRSDAASAGREVQTLAELRWQRLCLAAREGALGVFFGGWLFLIGLLMSGVAAVMFVLGLASGISALAGGTPWVGQLTTGALIVAAVAASYLLLRQRTERLYAERLRRRFGDPDADPASKPVSKKEPSHAP